MQPVGTYVFPFEKTGDRRYFHHVDAKLKVSHQPTYTHHEHQATFLFRKLPCSDEVDVYRQYLVWCLASLH